MQNKYLSDEERVADTPWKMLKEFAMQEDYQK